jgi:hypothetical protein
MGFSRQPLHILNRRGNRGIVDRIDRDGYNAGIRQEAIADCEREAVLAREICIRGIVNVPSVFTTTAPYGVSPVPL